LDNDVGAGDGASGMGKTMGALVGESDNTLVGESDGMVVVSGEVGDKVVIFVKGGSSSGDGCESSSLSAFPAL
jgi:hypothetical protein